MISVKHSGRIGDILYSAQVMKHYATIKGSKLLYLINVNQTWKKDGSHPMNDMSKSFELLKDLFGFWGIGLEKYQGQPLDYDLDQVKVYGNAFGLPYGDIKRWYYYAFPELNTGVNPSFLPSFTIKKEYDIIVSRSLRYQNMFVDYYAVYEKVKDKKIGFIGLDVEYSEFIEYWPTTERILTPNYFDALLSIMSAKYFLGNQSSMFALAEVVGKKNRILEVGEPNNVIPGKGGFDFHTTEGLIYYLCQ